MYAVDNPLPWILNVYSRCTGHSLHCKIMIFVTEFAKTDLMGTHTEIHFLPADESHTHALSRDTKHLRLDGQVCFFRQLFSDAEGAFHGLCGP